MYFKSIFIIKMIQLASNFCQLNFNISNYLFPEHAREALELSKLQESTKQQEVSRYHIITV